MTSERIRAVLKAEPFQPFRVHMGGGRSLDVAHPEFAHLHPSGRILLVFGLPDHMEIIDVLMVQSLEMLPASKRRTGGRRRAG